MSMIKSPSVNIKWQIYHWPLFWAKLRWTTYRTFERLGRLGCISLMLMPFLLLVLLIMHVQQQHALDALKQRVMQSATLQGDSHQPAPIVLSKYQALFPPFTERANALAQLMAMAQAQEVWLDQINYKQQLLPTLGLHKTILEFNVLTDYLSVRRFIQAMQKDMPYVAIESLSFSLGQGADMHVVKANNIKTSNKTLLEPSSASRIENLDNPQSELSLSKVEVDVHVRLALYVQAEKVLSDVQIQPQLTPGMP